MAIYITWTEDEPQLEGWEIPGNGLGVARPIFGWVTVKKRVLFSNDDSPEMVQRARDFVASAEMADRENVRIILTAFPPSQETKK
jgi:hypothetical protein